MKPIIHDLRTPRPVRLCVVGSTNVDLHLAVSVLPRPGETVLVDDVVRLPGGKGANQAVAAARLGADVSLVSAVGSDPDGQWSLDRLREEGVNVDRVAVVDAPTGLAVVMVERSAENAIVVVPGANRLVRPGDLSLDGCAAMLLSLEVPLEVVVASAKMGREAGVPVVLNAAPAQALPAGLVSCVDVLVVNKTEAEQVGPLEDAVRVVTLGSIGADVHAAGIVTRVSAARVQAVDTVGAGDCFAAALTLALAEGRTPVEAATLACHAAALSVTAVGARTGFPTRAELADSMAAAGHARGWPT